MLNFLGASSVLKVIVDILGVAGILVFGIFVLVFVVDLILSSTNDKEGLFFNKKKSNNKEAVSYNPEQKQEEPVADSNGVVYNPVKNPEENVEVKPQASEEEVVQPVDFDKAIEEQAELAKRNAVVEEPAPVSNNYFDDEEEDDITGIVEEVKNQALKELDEESNQKEEKTVTGRKVFKVKTAQPVAEEEPKENEEILRLQQERADLEKKLAELEELRKQDHEELLNAMQELKDKEPVVVEVDKNKEEEEKRKFANIARMNARLNSIKRNTDKLEKKGKEKATQKAQTVKTVVVEEEIIPHDEDEATVEQEIVAEKEAVVEQQPVVETAPVVAPVEEVVAEKVVEKPKFKKDYYENRLHILEQELKDAEKELKANNKEYAPLTKVKKAYERDSEKLRRKELVVAKQKVALYGVGNTNKKINPAKKEKLDENVRILKELKDSVFNCQQVIEQNKDRFPILEKNNKLLNKQIKRLQDDIASVNEAIDWYNNNQED